MFLFNQQIHAQLVRTRRKSQLGRNIHGLKTGILCFIPLRLAKPSMKRLIEIINQVFYFTCRVLGARLLGKLLGTLVMSRDLESYKSWIKKQPAIFVTILMVTY